MTRASAAPGQRSVVAVLPFRSLANAKSRLAGELDEEARRTLAFGLLHRAVDALCAGGVGRLAIVTLDDGLASAGADRRAEIILQRGRGLNGAIREGQAWARSNGATALLILLPDLPLLTAADIAALLDALATAPTLDTPAAVIAPDRHGTGTNALLLSPPDAIAPAFGPGSAERHRRSLALADIVVADVERPGLRLDLDTPNDLRQLAALARD